MRAFSILLAMAAASPSLILAANSTAAIGTDCNIVSTHTVVAGDGLANIATAANTTLDQVRFVNPQIANPRLINVGDVIQIPNSKCVAPVNPPLAEPTATCSNGTESTVKVAAGDSLIIIAKEKLGITLPSLLAANPQIKNPDQINVGDVVNVPLCDAQGKPTTGTTNGTATATTSTKAPKKTKGKRARIEMRHLDQDMS